MRQLITRVDDQLLDDVKARAKAEGVSVNTFVNRLLTQATRTMGRRREIARRVEEAGLAVYLTPSEPPPTHEEVWAMTSGMGPVAKEALAWARSEFWQRDQDGNLLWDRIDSGMWPAPGAAEGSDRPEVTDSAEGPAR